ncbi:hypothetical protein FQR65_LT03743 [Abscondita terminalis]|nr:hypothetical protein FQR65_LT03743 [Abscondita terminalis]
MDTKVIILFAIIQILSCYGHLGPVDFRPEEPCNQVGGMCIKKDECPTPIEYPGHCPEQQKDGAECCHGVSTKEYRCRKFGGHCVNKGSSCPKNLQRPQATDCPDDSFCCVLV